MMGRLKVSQEAFDCGTVGIVVSRGCARCTGSGLTNVFQPICHVRHGKEQPSTTCNLWVVSLGVNCGGRRSVLNDS